MKYLIVYNCSVNGNPDQTGNMISSNERTPVEWIAYLNTLNSEDKEKIVIKKFTLVNWWNISDYEASLLEDYGTGYLELQTVGGEQNEK